MKVRIHVHDSLLHGKISTAHLNRRRRKNGFIKEEDWSLSGIVCSTEYREKIQMGNIGQVFPETKEGPK